MKGGSLASDAVVEAVGPAAFAKLTHNFTNAVQDGGKGKKRSSKKPVAKHASQRRVTKSQKGGSLASDAVVEAVGPAAFAKLTSNFTNAVQDGGKRKRGKKGHKGGAATGAGAGAVAGAVAGTVAGAVAGASTVTGATLYSNLGQTAGPVSPSPASMKGAGTGRCPKCGKVMKGGSSTFQTMFANVSKVLTAHPLQTHETFNNNLAYRSEPAAVPSLNVTKALAPAPSIKGCQQPHQGECNRLCDHDQEGLG